MDCCQDRGAGGSIAGCHFHLLEGQSGFARPCTGPCAAMLLLMTNISTPQEGSHKSIALEAWPSKADGPAAIYRTSQNV